MKNRLVVLPPTKVLIHPSPGFEKKCLSEYHLELCALCGFGCHYCSSNNGNYLRIHREEFADLTEEQLGERVYPASDPSLMFVWPEVIEHLEQELANKPKGWGAGKTLVFSMQTDGFSPELVKRGITKAALELVLERTSFRIRVLTKNAIVGSDDWVELFKSYPGRFVVGLSTGTLDDEWARAMEVGTSSPSARLRATAKLQAAGVPTYGMLCPVFPDMLEGERLEDLIDAVSPAAAEQVWAEPFNDRTNWVVVRSSYSPESRGYAWLSDVYENHNTAAWSRYATDLYTRLRDKARREGWVTKLRYLLYEGAITQADAPIFEGLEGVLLQSKPDKDGGSKNPYIAALPSASGQEV